MAKRRDAKRKKSMEQKGKLRVVKGAKFQIFKGDEIRSEIRLREQRYIPQKLKLEHPRIPNKF